LDGLLADSYESNVSTTISIFVVHGYDNEAKESVARFLEKRGPIILDEQPSSGRTIIEKFETYLVMSVLL